MRYQVTPADRVEEGQEWAVFHGGIYDRVRVVEVLEGRFLLPPIAAIVPTEFCRVEYLTGRLLGERHYQRAPNYRLGGDGTFHLYRRADGTLTPLGVTEEKRRELRAELHQLNRRGAAIAQELVTL